jgi:predicted dehydrogenase
MINVIVIGFGSIGKRHYEILTSLGYNVGVVSKHYKNKNAFENIKDVLLNHTPMYIIICVETIKHKDVINQLIQLNYKGKVLVEKPLFVNYEKMPINNFQKIAVAYNLRFHPLIIKLKEILKKKDEQLISANFYVGSYLPNWRKNRDYTNSYSSSLEKGGGVLRDLSHEIDLAIYLLGRVQSLTALGGKNSNLNITSDDTFCILMNTIKCPLVCINLNYLEKIPQRKIIINTYKSTIRLDLINNNIEINGETISINIDYNLTYKHQHLAFLEDSYDIICSEKEGLLVNKIINLSEKASKTKTWIQVTE